MQMLLILLSGVLGIVSLVCFIMVVIQMFKNDQQGMGIACILLLFLCGIGGLVAFVIGWMNSAQWGIKNLMVTWTGCVVGSALVNILYGLMSSG